MKNRRDPHRARLTYTGDDRRRIVSTMERECLMQPIKQSYWQLAQYYIAQSMLCIVAIVIAIILAIGSGMLTIGKFAISATLLSAWLGS